MTKGVRVDFAVPRGTPTEACKDCKARIAFVKHPRTGNSMCLDVESRVWDEASEHYRCEVHQAHCPAYIRREELRRARRRRAAAREQQP